MVETIIYSIGLNNQWKFNKTTIYIYTGCGKPIKHKHGQSNKFDTVDKFAKFILGVNVDH